MNALAIDLSTHREEIATSPSNFNIVGEAPRMLCLKCRSVGHSATACPSPKWPSNEFGWFFSRERIESRLWSPSPDVEDRICDRCKDLNLFQLLEKDMPWETTAAMNEIAGKGTKNFRQLGNAGSVEFLGSCPLCRCLFAITPNPNSPTQGIFVITDWTMNRLAGEATTVTDAAGWSNFGKCILVGLGGSSEQLQFSVRIHRGDALAVVEEDVSHRSHHSLGGRLIHPTRLDIGIIQGWLTSCSTFHSTTCSPKWREDLRETKFVDVATRRIIAAPDGDFDYVALSYVWGGVHQQGYKLGSKLKALPRTIEDAIVLTRRLGKQYLWADSLCIDQEDAVDKENQIKKMGSIYQGAYFTLIALSGTSANSGLPRLRADVNMQPQVSCTINGKRLVGLMPTLSQQVWRSPWGSRAWTLQEGLLSPRCLYVGEHQLYFECNGMQCCESLNDTNSWAHHLRIGASPERSFWLESKVGAGCLRNPINDPRERLQHYGAKLTLYSYRRMTDKSDGLNAFLGILTSLERMYTKGFYFGLPLEDFQWGLLWASQGPLARREKFPSWSWAGWEGGKWPSYPADVTQPHQHPIQLAIRKVEGGKLVEMFSSSHLSESPSDPIAQIAKTELPSSERFDLEQCSFPEGNRYLFMDVIALKFIPDYTRSLEQRTPQYGMWAYFVYPLLRINCFIKIMSTDRELRTLRKTQKETFLLLARDVRDGYVYHHLLQVVSHRNVVERKTVVDLVIPKNSLEVLQDLEPTKVSVVLV